MAHDESTQQPSARLGRPGASGGARPGLLWLFGGGAALARPLPFDGDTLELGRGTPALSDAPDPRMSRRHARVRFDGRRFWVNDLGSQNGSFVDGKPLPPGAPREVRHVVRFGDSLFAPSADLRPFESLGVVVRDGFVRGPSLQRLLIEAGRAAEVGLSLHVRGESGTGKEGVARAFHAGGPQRGGPFVPVNCAAIPQAIAERLLFGAKRGAYSGADADAPGYLAAADGGTLFLDEIAELDLAVQAKLLRALESREVLALGAARPKTVNLHLCTASHRELRSQVAAGRLREDLYFRLGRPEALLPPLRQRPEEVPALIEREVLRVAPGLVPHVSLVEVCLLLPWPGNVRELLVEVRSATQAAKMQGCARVEAEHLSPNAGTPFEIAPVDGTLPTAPDRPSALDGRDVLAHAEPPRGKPLDEGERARIEETLHQQGGNVTAAARALGLHRTHLRRLIERYGLGALDRDDAEPE